MKRLIFINILILFPLITYSQIVNVQKFLKSDAPKGFSMAFKGALDFRTGNTELIKTDLALAGRYAIDNHLILLVAEGGYAEKSDKRFISKTFEHLRYRYQFVDWLGLELFGQYEFDEFRRIDVRTLGGLGPRVTMLSSKVIEISIGSAYMFEFNRNSVGSYTDSGYESNDHRWSSYLNLDIRLADNLTFFTTTYIQPKFDQFSDYRLLNDNSIDIKINNWLSFILMGKIAYDNQPPNRVKNLDTSVFTGIKVSYEPNK